MYTNVLNDIYTDVGIAGCFLALFSSLIRLFIMIPFSGESIETLEINQEFCYTIMLCFH